MLLRSDHVIRRLSVAFPVAMVAVVAWVGWAVKLAERDQAGPNRLMIPVRIQQAVEAHVYYDIGQGLWHGDQAVRSLEGHPEWRVVEFALPRVPVRELRFDPMVTPGTFALKAPWLESATGRTIAKFPLAAVTARHQIAAWRIEDDAFVAETLADADDAQVMLGLGAPLRVGQPRWPWPEGLVGLALIFASVWVRRQPAAWRPRWDVTGWGRRLGRAGRRVGGLAMAVYGSTTPRAVMGGAVLVVVGQWWVMRGLDETLDLPLWDESNYASRGVEWLPKGGPLGDLHTGPAYAVQYGLVAMGGTVESAVYRQHYLVKIGGVLLLYLLLVRWWQVWPAAAAIALAWGGSWFQTEYPLLVYQAAWMWFLAALWLVDRWPVIALATLLWAVGVRQDYQFVVPFLLVAVVMCWRRHAGSAGHAGLSWGGGRRERVFAGVVGVVLLIGIGAVASNVSLGGVGKRGWFAFQQHYAVRATVVEGLTDFNPLAEYPQIMERDFPEATSLGEAWRINPGAIVGHVRWNLGRALIELRHVWSHVSDRRAVSWGLWATGVLALLASARKASDTSRPRWRASEVTALGGLVVIAPGLIVLAKGPYMLAVVPLGLAMAAGVLRWGGAKMPKRVRRGMAVVGLIVGVATAGMWVSGGSVFSPGSRPMSAQQTLAVLREVWPSEGKYTLVGYSASSYANYLGNARCHGVESINAVSGDATPDLSVAALLERDRPFAVLVTAEWRQAGDVDEAPLLARVAAGSWLQREVPSGRLYWRVRP